CLTKIDYLNAYLGLSKAQNMQPAIQVVQRDITSLAICFSGVSKHQRSIDIDFCRSIERELALFDVSLIFDRVKVDFHEP
ncbi:MAG: hypothetical protein WAU04_08070, partial [Candidatus Nitrotoga sp.]